MAAINGTDKLSRPRGVKPSKKVATIEIIISEIKTYEVISML